MLQHLNFHQPAETLQAGWVHAVWTSCSLCLRPCCPAQLTQNGLLVVNPEFRWSRMKQFFLLCESETWPQDLVLNSLLTVLLMDVPVDLNFLYPLPFIATLTHCCTAAIIYIWFTLASQRCIFSSIVSLCTLFLFGFNLLFLCFAYATILRHFPAHNA